MLHKSSPNRNLGRRVRPLVEVTEAMWQVMDDAARAIGADAVSICLRRNGSRVVNRIMGREVPRRFVEAVGTLSVEDFYGVAKLLSGRQPSFWSDEVPNDPRCGHPLFQRVPMQTALVTRVQAGSEMLGAASMRWMR